MEFVYSDGGRSNYFKADNVGDCVCRAICNAGGYDYKDIYDMLKEAARAEKTEKHNGKRSSVRDGVYKDTRRKVLEELGWEWHPTMSFGTGCTVHLRADELPAGNLIVSVSRHLTCVRDGVLYDTYDCSRDGTRCVYGYYTKRRELQVGDKVMADKLLCEILEINEDEDGVKWYGCTPVSGYARGFIRQFTADSLRRV